MILAKRDGRLVFHWPASIQELVKAQELVDKHKMEYEDFSNLRRSAIRAARNWQLCACGSLCDAIPREKVGARYGGQRLRDFEVEPLPHQQAPIDNKLRDLGFRFYGAITNARYKQAETILANIEKRAGAVLEKLGKKIKRYTKPIKK